MPIRKRQCPNKNEDEVEDESGAQRRDQKFPLELP
jgi:hypothetical protein